MPIGTYHARAQPSQVTLLTQNDVNLHTLLGSPAHRVVLRVLIPPGADIGGTTPRRGSLRSGPLAANSYLLMKNRGKVMGKGGDGGHGGWNDMAIPANSVAFGGGGGGAGIPGGAAGIAQHATFGTDGAPGTGTAGGAAGANANDASITGFSLNHPHPSDAGHAIELEGTITLRLDNLDGEVWGGGGGGRGGSGGFDVHTLSLSIVPGDGGGPAEDGEGDDPLGGGDVSYGRVSVVGANLGSNLQIFSVSIYSFFQRFAYPEGLYNGALYNIRVYDEGGQVLTDQGFDGLSSTLVGDGTGAGVDHFNGTVFGTWNAPPTGTVKIDYDYDAKVPVDAAFLSGGRKGKAIHLQTGGALILIASAGSIIGDPT